jgi:hypothetical protein
MGGKKKKKKPAEPEFEAPDAMEAEGMEGDASGVSDTAVDPQLEFDEDGNPIDAGSGAEPDSLEDILGDLDDASSPLVPDQIGGEFDPDYNPAIDDAQQKGPTGMSARMAKRKAEREKRTANKQAALQSESQEKRRKERQKRMRTVAQQQNKTARERIMRGQTGSKGRMFNRMSAKFQIPDNPINLPGTGGSGSQYN